MLFGGGPGDLGLAFLAIALAGLALIVVVLLNGGFARFQTLPLVVRLAAGATVALPFLQLVPLPPALWTALPGEGLRVDVLQAVGLAGSWQPISGSLPETVYTCVVAMIMFAFLMSILTLRLAEIYTILWIFVGLLALEAAIGVVQFATNSSVLNYHSYVHRNAAVGFFANKNHMALALACVVPVVYELVIRNSGQRSTQAIYVGLMALVVLPVLVASNSRAGVLLGLFAIAICLVQIFWEKRRKLALAGGAALALVFIAIQFVPNVSDVIDRFGDTQAYGRVEILERSVPLVTRFWLTGAGIGSFENLFATQERLEWVYPYQVNHAHNDYVEFMIEAGLFGLAILVLWALALRKSVVVFYRSQKVRLSRSSIDMGLVQVGLVIITLFAVHSIVDYPVRRVATLTMLVFAVGLAFRPLLRSAEVAKS